MSLKSRGVTYTLTRRDWGWSMLVLTPNAGTQSSRQKPRYQLSCQQWPIVPESVCFATNSYHPPLHTQHPAKRIIFSLTQLSCSEIGVLFDGAGFFSGKLSTGIQDTLYCAVDWGLCRRPRKCSMSAFLTPKLWLQHLLPVQIFEECSFVLLWLFIMSTA